MFFAFSISPGLFRMGESHIQTCVAQTFPLLQGQADCTGWEALEQEGQAAWRDLDSVCSRPNLSVSLGSCLLLLILILPHKDRPPSTLWTASPGLSLCSGDICKKESLWSLLLFLRSWCLRCRKPLAENVLSSSISKSDGPIFLRLSAVCELPGAYYTNPNASLK